MTWREILESIDLEAADRLPTALPGECFVGVILDIGVEEGAGAPAVRGVFTDPDAAGMAFDGECRRLEILPDEVVRRMRDGCWREFVEAGGSLIGEAARYCDAADGLERALVLVWSRLNP